MVIEVLHESKERALVHQAGRNDVESILARVQYYLNENDLDTATRELNQLKGWPKKLAEDWIKAARNHLEIKQAMEVCIYNIIVFGFYIIIIFFILSYR